MVDDYKADDFRSAEGETFEVEHEGATVGLELERVQDLPAGIRESGCFRLAFRGPVEPVLPQAIYGLAQGGRTYDIFIVPTGQDDQSTRYEAVFN